MTATRIGVVGASGRMGRMLIEATLKDDLLALGAAFDLPGSPAIGKSAGELVGMASDVLVTDDRIRWFILNYAAAPASPWSLVPPASKLMARR